MPKKVTDAHWRTFNMEIAKGRSTTEAARTAGISISHAYRARNGQLAHTTAGAQIDRLLRDLDAPPVRAKHQMGRHAKRALEDFEHFRRHYLGHPSTPWQVQAANLVVELLATPEREFLVMNMPPGSGKSALMHDIAAWCIVRDRSVRILFGSNTEHQARKLTQQLRANLERRVPPQAEESERRRGLACDAGGTLANDYGAFRPTTRGIRWTDKEFVVTQPGDTNVTQKESTVTAYGRDSGYLGVRMDLCIWDDLTDAKINRTPEGRAKLEEDYDSMAETRLEPGGLLILVGQRLAATDLYRYCVSADAVTVTADGERALRDVVAGDQVLTRDGYREVLYSGSQGIKRTVVLTTTGGRSLTLTGDHQVAVPGGWVRADRLIAGTDLCVVGQAESLPLPVERTPVSVAAGTAHTALADVGVLDRVLVPPVTVGARHETADVVASPHVAPMVLADEMFQPDTARIATQMTGLTPLRYRGTAERELPQHHAADKLLVGESPDAGLGVPGGAETPRPHAALADPFGAGSQPLLGEFRLPGMAPVAGTAADAGGLAHGHTTIDTVRSVTHGPMIETWDLTVDATPEFYANGVLVHNCLDKKGAPPLDEEGNEVGEGQPKYRHVVFPAHDEARCTGQHPRTLQPWPESCLLDPIRVDWHTLRTSMLSGTSRYRTVYQQEDVDPGSALVDPAWVTGGLQPDGMMLPGCWDDDRAQWQWPKQLAGRSVTVGSVDPSGAQLWALGVWEVQLGPTLGDTVYHLIASERRRMVAGQLLDSDGQGGFSGMMPDWSRTCRDNGHRITTWAIETNAAQKYLLQYRHTQDWMRSSGCAILSHACVDSQTQVLSQRGWLSSHEVAEGDMILTLNTVSGASEWKPVRGVYRGQHDGLMHRYRGSIDALCTLDHKWPRTDQKHSPLALVESQHLNTNSVIPLARPLTPEQEPAALYSDDLVELVGWAVTEGHFNARHTPGITTIDIGQSMRTNPDKCERLRLLLKRLGAHYRESDNGSGWGVHVFAVSGEVAKAVRAITDHRKHLPPEFIAGLPAHQRALLLDVLTITDGWYAPAGLRNFCSNTDSLATAYEMLCALQGRPTTRYIRHHPPPRQPEHYAVREKHASHTYLQNRSTRPTVESYSGEVWCPSTVNGTFYARRNGHTYFTGNTNINKHDPERGIETLGSIFRQGRIRLPGALGQSRRASSELVAEATRYPYANTTDLLMMMWFVVYNTPKLAPIKTPPRRQVPSWMNDQRTLRAV